MALISCSECGNQVSDKAAACPKCGNPIATARPRRTEPTSASAEGTEAVTIEATGKGPKTMMLVGTGVMILGFASCAGGNEGAGISLFLLGGVLYLGASATAWWYHG